MTAGLVLMKNKLTPLAKSILIPLGISVEMSAADTAIQKKIYGSEATALIISNEEMEDIIKTVKSIQDSGLLIKWISETKKNETKVQEGGFLPLFLGTLAASVLGNAFTGIGVIRAGEGVMKASLNF